MREVLAHRSAALMRVVENRFEEGVFSPASDDRDITERSDWTDAQVVDELERGTTEVGSGGGSVVRAGRGQRRGSGTSSREGA